MRRVGSVIPTPSTHPPRTPVLLNKSLWNPTGSLSPGIFPVMFNTFYQENYTPLYSVWYQHVVPRQQIMSHLMRKGPNTHAQPLNRLETQPLNRPETWPLLVPYIVVANNEGSVETARMHGLAWAFVVRLCDKYSFHVSRLICLSSFLWQPILGNRVGGWDGKYIISCSHFLQRKGLKKRIKARGRRCQVVHKIRPTLLWRVKLLFSVLIFATFYWQISR